MPTKWEELEAQRQALPPERLLPAYRLDAATREKYKNQPIMRGVASTKSEQLNLGDAAAPPSDLQVRTGS